MTVPPHADPYDSVLGTIGWTPLIRLARVGAGIRTPVYGKAEFANPGGSVKDRIGLAIIEAAEQDGSLAPGGTVVEGTSGNTGVGLAIAAALKGYHCIFTMPDKMSQEKVRLLRAYGAEVVITPTAVPPDHPENYVMKAKAIGPVEAESFHIQLFMYMAAFHLGPMLDKALSRKLKQVRIKIEKERIKDETAFSNKEMNAQEFVDAFNKATIEFQDEMASVMKPEQYETIFDLKVDDHVLLADPKIVKKVFGFK